MIRQIRKLVADVILFLLGVAIIMKQAGIYWEPPAGGPEIELIILGGLLCNGPVMLQALAVRSGSGTSSSGPRSVPPGPASPSEPSPESSGGDR